MVWDENSPNKEKIHLDLIWIHLNFVSNGVCKIICVNSLANKSCVQNGFEVTVPEREISIGDWYGLGYIVANPNDGTGAYMISGGYGGVAREIWKYIEQKTGKKIPDWVKDVVKGALG